MLFENLDILVLPSYDTKGWKEQFGHILLSAMASRTCIVGSNSGAIPDVINNARLIFQQKNVEDLYRKSLKLFNNKKLVSIFGKKGFNRVSKYYTNYILAEKTLKIYKIYFSKIP